MCELSNHRMPDMVMCSYNLTTPVDAWGVETGESPWVEVTAQRQIRDLASKTMWKLKRTPTLSSALCKCAIYIPSHITLHTHILLIKLLYDNSAVSYKTKNTLVMQFRNHPLCYSHKEVDDYVSISFRISMCIVVFYISKT